MVAETDIAALRIAAMKAVRRQIEGCLGLLGSGGKIPLRGCDGVDEESEEQMGVEPGSGEVGVLGRQAVEIEDRLHALEGEFDLPADGIEVFERGCGNLGFAQGGEQDEMVCGGERARIARAVLVLAVGVLCLGARGGCGCGGLGQDDEAQGERLEAAARARDADGFVDEPGASPRL